MDMKIVGISVTALVVVIVLAGVLMPVLDDATDKEDSFKNKCIFYANPLDANTSTIIEWKYTDPTSLKIGDATLDMSNLESPYSAITIAVSDDWLVRYQLDPTSVIIGVVDSVSTSIATASTDNQKDMKIEIDSGAVTFTVGTDTYDYAIDGGFMISADGKGTYVMKLAGDEVYVNSDSLICGAGRTGRPFGTGTALSVIANGSIDDGMTIRYAPNTYTVGESTIASTEVSGYKDLYKLTGFAFDVSNGVDTTTITYNQILVPAEVTAEKSTHLSDNESAILMVIPIMVVVALLVAVVALVFRSREF